MSAWAPTKTCPHCESATSFRVTESRAMPGAGHQRRRWLCSSCGHAETTYEVSQQRYLELSAAAKDMAKIRAMLGASLAAPATETTCEGSCEHWRKGQCGFDWPEAGGPFASECSNFADRATRLGSES